MTRRLRLLSRAMALALAFVATDAAAQQAPSVQVRGEVSSVDGRQLTIQTGDGQVVRVGLAPDARIFAMAPAKAEAIGPEAVVGVVGPSRTDERITASTVVIFPDALNGPSEGYFTWDPDPDSTLRHGSVRSAEAGPQGRVITLAYPQGGATAVIPPEAAVVTLEPGDPSLLRQGANVFIPSAERHQDGSFAAGALAVGRNGFVPPM